MGNVLERGDKLKNKIKCFRCNDFIWEELEKFCNATGQTPSMFIRAALVEKLQRVQGYENYIYSNNEYIKYLNNKIERGEE